MISIARESTFLERKSEIKSRNGVTIAKACYPHTEVDLLHD